MAAEGEEEEDDDVAKLYPAFAWTRNGGVLVGGVLAEEEEELRAMRARERDDLHDDLADDEEGDDLDDDRDDETDEDI